MSGLFKCFCGYIFQYWNVSISCGFLRNTASKVFDLGNSEVFDLDFLSIWIGTLGFSV